MEHLHFDASNMKTSPFFHIIYSNGTWYLNNSIQLNLHIIDPPNLEILKILKVIFKEENVNIASLKTTLGVANEDADDILKQLLEIGVFVKYACEIPWADEGLFSWANTDLASYNGSYQFSNYKDYSDSDVHEVDQQRMVSFLKESCPPSYWSSECLGKFVSLPHPAFYPENHIGSSFFEKLAFLLFWTFGAVRFAKFLEVLSVPLKTVPATGARHPFFAEIVFNIDKPTEIVAMYDMRLHGLLIEGNDSIEIADECTIRVVLIFDFFQWRYRSSAAWKDLFLDLGHLNEHAKFVVERLGLRMQFDFDMPLDIERELINEIIVE